MPRAAGLPNKVFAEHGALMTANILNSLRAVPMSVYVIRALAGLRFGSPVQRSALYPLHSLAPPPHPAFLPRGWLIQLQNPLEERVVLVEPLLEGQGGVGAVIVEQLVERGLDPHLHIVVVRVLGGPGAG